MAFFGGQVMLEGEQEGGGRADPASEQGEQTQPASRPEQGDHKGRPYHGRTG